MVSFPPGLDDSTCGGMQLLSDPLYTLPTDNVYVHAIASTQQGRVFLAGRDGCLYELAYQAEAGWFSQHCRKINHSKSSLSFLVPSMLQFTFSDDGEARRDRHFRNISRYLCGASAAEPRVRGGGLAAKPPRRLPAATNPPLHPQDGAAIPGMERMERSRGSTAKAWLCRRRLSAPPRRPSAPHPRSIPGMERRSPRCGGGSRSIWPDWRPWCGATGWVIHETSP